MGRWFAQIANGAKIIHGYLDTKATNHICGVKSMFLKLDESVSSNVVFGDECKVEVLIGRGYILI